MSPCDNLISFVDGQLDADDAEAFREHLRTCETCPDDLIEAVQLSAHLSTLPPPTPSTRVPVPPAPAEPPSTVDGRESQASHPMSPSSGGTATPVIPIRDAIKPTAVGWKRAVGWSTGFAAVIAATVGVWQH